MEKLTRFTLEHPVAAWVVLVLVTAVFGLGLARMRVEHGSRALVGSEHPIIKRLDSVVERFGGGLPVLIGWPCGEGWPCANALDSRSITLARDLTEWLDARPEVRKVVSPSNATLLVPVPGGVRVRRLVEDGIVAEDLEGLALLAREDKLWSGRLISRDLDAASILIQPVDNATETSEALLDEIEEVLERYRQDGFEFMFEGMAVRAIVSGRDLNDSTARIIPALVALIGLVLLLLTRSISQTAVALVTMGVALLWTQGLMGWLGWPQDGIHQVLAPLILIVGVCDAVHLLSKAAEFEGSIRGRLLSAVQEVGPPCVVTTATTAVALASFTTSGMDSFVRFGAISATGVTFCLVLSFSLLPLLAVGLRWFSFPDGGGAPAVSLWMESLAREGQLRSKTVVRVATALFVLGGAGWAGYLTVDTDWVLAFGEDSRISQWIQFFDERFGSNDTLEVQLELPEGETFEDPKNLAIVDRLGVSLEAFEGMGSGSSIVLPLERLNRALHDGDSAYEVVADSRAGNAELLELIAIDDPESLVPWLTMDRRVARLSVDGELVRHSESRRRMAGIRQVLRDVIPADWKIELTGLFAVDEAWTSEVQATQLRSFPTAFALVFLLASFFLRSVRLGFAAMVPTLVPVVVVLGTMGWVGIGLDIGRAMVAAVVIGIGVDDAIHFLYDYKKRVRGGATSSDAIRGALRATGRALVMTSAALSVGFLALLGSAWQTISSFGFFVSLTIVAALFSTLFLLPALLSRPFAGGVTTSSGSETPPGAR